MTTSNISRRRFLQAGCAAVACGSMDALLPQLNLMSTALAQSVAPGYKALVCLYLDGGNDSWNLLIPNDATRHAAYTVARNGLWAQGTNTGGLAIPRSDDPGFVAGTTLPRALPIAGGQYGVNPFAPEIAQLFGEGKLAFLANIGTLVQPLTRANYNSPGVRKPPQLYSHNDQTNLWHIGTSNSSQVPQGFGGRIAGAVAKLPIDTAGLPPTISIAGQTRYLVGRTANNQPLFPFSLSTSATTPATSLSNYNPASTNQNQFQPARRAALEELLAAANPHPFSTEYGDIVERSLTLADELINPMINPQLANPNGYPRLAADDPVHGGGTTGFTWPNTSLGNQLRQVARMIRISKSRSGFASPIDANRQVFFVRIGGFDTHDGQITSPTAAQAHHGLFQQISQAVFAFQRAMAAIGSDNEVTLYTASDFARTINSNGNGTDHAWGGVQFVMGGAVNGGQVYGRYPSIVLNNAMTGSVSVDPTNGECFSRGQFLPTMSVDQLGASLARWMGVSNTDIPAIFPNIDNFSGSVMTPTFAYYNRVITNLMAGVA